MRTTLLRSGLAGFALIALTGVIGGPATAQTYPAKPVKVIVPYPPGGGVDPVARIIAQKLSATFGVQFYVENLPGAGGTLGTGTAANAGADGYTILFMNPDFVVQPIIKSKVPYDPFKSFEAVTLIGVSPEMIVVHPSVPAKNMEELIALLRANPGKYNVATPGYGTSPHLASERLFKLSHGLEIVHVPFQGGAPAIASTIAGHTTILHLSMSTLAPHIKQGTLRALAVTGNKRSRAFPDVPTLEESGIPHHEVEYMIGVATPAKTGTEIINLLQGKIAAIVSLPEIKERLIALGLEPVASTPEEFSAKLKEDFATWSKVVRDANIKID